MPRHNGSGPMGYGPGTGRGMGHCGGAACGRRGVGFGRGCGWRRFGGNDSLPAMTESEESEMLADEAKALENELKAVNSRLSQIKDKDQK